MPPTKHRTTRRIHTASVTEPPVETPATDPVTDEVLEPASPGNAPNPATTIHVSREDLIASLRRSVEGAAPEMIKAVIGQGKEGSYLHTKFLFEFAGLTAIPAGDASAEQSLAAVLLRALALNENDVATGVSPVVPDLQPCESPGLQPSKSPGPQHSKLEEKDNQASVPSKGQEPKANDPQQAPPLLSPAFGERVAKANGACKAASARP
jgi:hypothetical protein